MGSNFDGANGLQPYGDVLAASYYAIATSYGTEVYVGCLMEVDPTSVFATSYGQLRGAQVEALGAGGGLLGACLGVYDSNMELIQRYDTIEELKEYYLID